MLIHISYMVHMHNSCSICNIIVTSALIAAVYAQQCPQAGTPTKIKSLLSTTCRMSHIIIADNEICELIVTWGPKARILVAKDRNNNIIPVVRYLNRKDDAASPFVITNVNISASFTSKKLQCLTRCFNSHKQHPWLLPRHVFVLGRL